MQLGSVFIWKNFPFREEGKAKDRYFVYFGESHYPDNPIKVFLITTTSKVNKYEEDGNRKNHIHYKFKAGYFGFVEDCILDFDSCYSIEEENFEKHKDDMEERGKLTKFDLINIYNLLLKSRYYSKKEKQDIHTNYNFYGIKGLKNP
ncbi:MAG: hypothetical protein MUP69_08180 [Candidatus Atribacteria bacterium]|nr:hypothetical protein [Candidatus Atribacteria bacterium]